MKHLLLLLATLLCTFTTFAIEVLDTVYYDSEWKGCSKTFSTYYRVMTRPSAQNPLKQFRDFYMNGAVRGEGHYIAIDKKDDSNSIFDGAVVVFYKSGETMSITQWNNSHIEGDVVTFRENGVPKSHCFYNEDGLLHGQFYYFDESGNVSAIYYYDNGNIQSRYKLFNQYGAQGEYDITSDEYRPSIISISNMKEKIIRQKKYYYYDDNVNGIYLSLTLDAVKHYGKYYGIGITLFNNTNTSFVFDPGLITAIGRFSKGNKKTKSGDKNNLINTHEQDFGEFPQTLESQYIKVWKYDDYGKKVNKRQFWNKVLVAVGAGVTTADAGYSSSRTTITSQGNAKANGYANASVYGPYGFAQGNAHSSANANGSTTTKIKSTSYDAFEAAIEREKAANDFAVYAASLEADAQAINENYLMKTTLDPQTQIAGYFLLDKDEPEIIDLTIPVNGVEYRFRLTELPK